MARLRFRPHRANGLVRQRGWHASLGQIAALTRAYGVATSLPDLVAEDGKDSKDGSTPVTP